LKVDCPKCKHPLIYTENGFWCLNEHCLDYKVIQIGRKVRE